MVEALRGRLLKLAFWIPLAVATALALLPKGAPMPFAISDILQHLFAFTYLTAALGIAYYPSNAAQRTTAVICWMLAYGLSLEAIQYFIPERSAEFKDLAVDAVGIALGIALWRRFVARYRERSAPPLEESR